MSEGIDSIEGTEMHFMAAEEETDTTGTIAKGTGTEVRASEGRKCFMGFKTRCCPFFQETITDVAVEVAARQRERESYLPTTT